MSIHITSGAASTYLQGILNNNTNAYGKVLEQLSSGNKYTSIGDNPVAVTKTAKLGVQIGVNSVVSDNVSLGQDLISFADQSQSSVMNDLQRIYDLTVQAANGTYPADSKDAIINEIRGQLSAIDSVADSTSFAGAKLLDGSSGNLTLQIGTASSATLNIGSALIDVHASALGGDLTLGPSVTGSTWTQADIETYLGKISTAMDEISKAQGEAGGYANRLDYAAGNLNSIDENLVSLRSSISDVDVATATTELVKYQVLQQASANVLNQTNQVSAWALKLLQK